MVLPRLPLVPIYSGPLPGDEMAIKLESITYPQKEYQILGPVYYDEYQKMYQKAKIETIAELLELSKKLGEQIITPVKSFDHFIIYDGYYE